MKAEFIEHVRVHTIVCPHCGYSYMEAYDYPDSGEIRCPECMCEFGYYRDVIYSTEKLTKGTP